MPTKRKATIAELLKANKEAAPPPKKLQIGDTVSTTIRDHFGNASTMQEPVSCVGMGVQIKSEAVEMKASADESKPPNTSRSVDSLECFEDIKNELTVWFLRHDYDPNVNLPCSCGSGQRVVQCQDCQDFDICCEECWLRRHQHSPWHWARVWNGRFFVRSDISTLRKQGFAVQLGHHGAACPALDKPRPIKFIIFHSNGVHGTLVSFCNCRSTGKVEQLMKSHLFLATAVEPETAYTFSMMKEYDIHSLQGQIPAYDWVFSLRRLTDNAHTHTVNDPYNSFMLAARVWQFIHNRLRHGEFYSLIPRTLPHLPPDTFVTRCPACPDPDVNMVDGWWKTPLWLRHLNMFYTTLDGNCKTHRFQKKGDYGDCSLYKGQSYYGNDNIYNAFLKKAGKKKLAEPVPDCDSMKVITRLTDLATHGMAVTGTVNHQCSHIFIMGVTDMYSSENQANVDAAFSRGYWLYGYNNEKINKSATHHKEVPHKQMYNAEYAYAVNQVIRFHTFCYLWRHRKFVTRLERDIPVVHITGHKLLVCKILLALFYHWCNSHFTRETAEQAWPFLNRVAHFSCQAGAGHRHDIHIVHIDDHNLKKLANLAYLIAWELVIAAAQLEDNMTVFRQLSWVHQAEVAAWSQQDMVPRENPNVPGSWLDVYHRPEKELAPSVAAVLESITHQAGGGISLALPNVGLDLNIYWERAFEAEEIQEKISILGAKSHLTETDAKTLNNLYTWLDIVLELFRQRQAIVTPRLPDRFSGSESEEFVLALPSDMTPEERVMYGTSQLAIQESTLRRSHAYNTINSLQSTCRKIEVLLLYRDQNASTNAMQTRMGMSLQGVLDVRERQLAVYNHSRQMLVRLGTVEEDMADTERKDINHKRRTGDSKRREGVAWTLNPTTLSKLPEIQLGMEGEAVLDLVSATRLTRWEVRHSRSVWDGLREATKKANKANKDPAQPAIPKNAKEKRDAKRDKQFCKSDNKGTLWNLGARGGMLSTVLRPGHPSGNTSGGLL
ncbi:hypothetical protein PQX77_020526 [Marasmius sp. AFHP31]|nr:hypothetical protein PQX77_020526 [Marasmius sp. AFHP31]